MTRKTSRRLLFLSESVGFGPHRTPGGGELFAVELLLELVKRRWDITIACPAHGPLFHHPKLKDIVSWETIDLSVKIKAAGFLKVVWRWLFLSHRFSDHILYGNGFATMKWLVFASILWRAPVFCHLHESAYEAYDSRRARLLAPFINRFFAISDSVRDIFIAGARIDEDKVIRIHNGVPVFPPPVERDRERVKVCHELDLPNSNQIVMMAARTDPLKGHETFLRAVKPVLAKVPDATFLIAGFEAETPSEVALYKHLSQIIELEKIGHALRTLGFRNDVRRLMRAADVLVVPSTAEGFGRTAIEGMAEQTPVVASRIGGLKEIITDRVDGWLFSPGDHHALAECLVEILQKPQAAREIAQRGYQTAKLKFSTEQMTDLIEGQLLADC